MADQRIITLYGGDATPSTIILRELPVADVVTTTITLYGLDATPSTIVLRDPTLSAAAGTVEATVSPTLATLTVNGLSVTQQTLAVLLPNTSTLAFAGYIASIAAEAIISPTIGAVALLGPAPAITTGGVTEATITPDAAILGASGSVPWIELEATGKSAKYRNRRTKYWYDEPKLPDQPVVTPALPENPPALNVVAIPDSDMGAEINRVNREIADVSQKLEAYRRRRAKRREEEAIIALLAA